MDSSGRFVFANHDLLPPLVASPLTVSSGGTTTEPARRNTIVCQRVNPSIATSLSLNPS